MKKRIGRVGIKVIGFVLLLCAPQLALSIFGSEYAIDLLVQAMIFGILASSLNLLVGFLGLPSLGHAAYLGISAYIAAICITKLGSGIAVSAVIAILGTGVSAAIFGLFALRARGVYFLMITLALGIVVWGFANRWISVTSGEMGIAGIPRPEIAGISLQYIGYFYYVVLVTFWGSCWLMMRIGESPFGRSLVGIKESESRMRALGYNCWIHQYMCFVISGLFAGIAGVLFVHYHQFISPPSVSVVPNLEVLLMVALGGPGTAFGPLLGAGIIIFLKNFISIYTDRWVMILGFIYITTVLWAPQGLLGAIGNATRTKWLVRLRAVFCG